MSEPTEAPAGVQESRPHEYRCPACDGEIHGGDCVVPGGDPLDGDPSEAPDYRAEIVSTIRELEEFLIRKNDAYGNSAFEPIRIFSKSGPLEQLYVRLDDKLSRIRERKTYEGDDDELDAIGYLILIRTLKRILRRLGLL